MIKQALSDPRTYGVIAAIVLYVGFVYLLGTTDPFVPLLDWAVGGMMFFMTLIYFIKPSFIDFALDNVESKRPTIKYLIDEGFINLVPNEDDFSYTVKVDTSNCPWQVEVTYLNSYTEIHYSDSPGEAYVFDNKLIDRQ